MELTKVERLILLNQYKILNFLEPNSLGNYKETIEILESGYKIYYSEINKNIMEEMEEEESQFVLDVLSLYREIEDFKLMQKDEEISKHTWGRFLGFDGNHESDHLFFTRFLIHVQEKFAEQKVYAGENDDFNSHMPTLDKYESMLAVREKYYQDDPFGKLTKEQIIKILDANNSIV